MDFQALADRCLVDARYLCGDFPDIRNRQTGILPEQCTEYPDTAGDRGCPRSVRCNRLDARLRHDAPAVAFGSNRHTAEGISRDTGDVVKPCHPLVYHHKIGLDQVTDIQIVVQKFGEERFGLADHRCFQVAVILRIEVMRRRVGTDLAQSKPLSGEVLDKRRCLCVTEHPVDLCPSYTRLEQRAIRSRFEEDIIRHTRPQKI